MSSINDLFETTRRQSYSLGLSVSLHALILFLMLFNFSWSENNADKTPPAILMVDLTKVQISDKTNLPPKAEKKKTMPKQTVVQPKAEKKPEPVTKTPAVKRETPQKAPEVKPVQKEPVKEAAKVIEKKQPPKEKPQQKPKETPKLQPKPKPKQQTKPKSQPKPGGLQSLLASVEKVKKPVNSLPEETTPVDESLAVNDGIEGGTSGSRLEILSVSEKDFISNKIKENWNVNAGVENAENMIIELSVLLNKDGSVKDVRILNQKSNPAFQSMAESARRAIYICDGLGEESPFRILAKKHTKNYNTWKNINLHMNPINGGVF